MSSSGLSIYARGLMMSYEEGRIRALRSLDFDVDPGEFVAIMGPSGCGKSTLLNVLGGLDLPDAGTLELGGRELTEKDLAEYRSRRVGFVFQLHNLIPVLTAVENVQVPMLGVTGPKREERLDRAMSLISAVGLEDRDATRPPKLSGGERQRVAVARALANDPDLILADEPTGSLDSESGARILDLLARVCEESGATLVLVTHDEAVAARAQRVIRMLDGRIL